MNRDDIIRMAKEAEAWGLVDHDGIAALERFAALVYAEAHKDGLDDFETVVLPAAIKAEREACADRAGIALLGADRGLANRVDYAIRERGQA